MAYNIQDWYWSGPLGVFSSASNSIVPGTDPAFEAWSQTNSPTPWPRDENGSPTTLALDKMLMAGGAPVSGLTPLTQSQLASELVSAATAACSAITTQIAPDGTHQNAYLNAASILAGNGGVAPSTGPLAAKFSALATKAGSPSAEAFALVITTGQGASLDLSAALMGIEGAAATATTPEALTSALAIFEAALANVVAELNAVMPSPVTSPAAIEIQGI